MNLSYLMHLMEFLYYVLCIILLVQVAIWCLHLRLSNWIWLIILGACLDVAVTLGYQLLPKIINTSANENHFIWWLFFRSVSIMAGSIGVIGLWFTLQDWVKMQIQLKHYEEVLVTLKQQLRDN